MIWGKKYKPVNCQHVILFNWLCLVKRLVNIVFAHVGQLVIIVCLYYLSYIVFTVIRWYTVCVCSCWTADRDVQIQVQIDETDQNV